MSITKKTAAEYASEIETAILSRNSAYDTKVGPIRDLVIQPLANILELQNERAISINNLLSLINNGSFADSDLDNFVFNELLIRLGGAQSSVSLIFSRAAVPTVDITVQANFPVATIPDETTGVTYTFLTTAAATLSAANAASYFNSATQRYELSIPALVVVGSADSNVGPNRITRPLRALNGFDSVFNRVGATGGRDPEVNASLIERYYISLLGTSPSVVDGIQKILRDQFPIVLDSNVVFGNDPLNVRSATDGGAVDVYTIGTQAASATDTIIFPGARITIPLLNQPVDSISSAIGVSPVVTYVQGTDYISVLDTSGYAGSVRGADGIQWLATGTLPSVGAAVNVTYVYNALQTTLQNQFSLPDKVVPGRDILFKEAVQENVTLTANIKIHSGFNVQTILNAVSAALLTLINTSNLNALIEISNIQATVRSFSGVDNFIVTNLNIVGLPVSTVDLQMASNQYAQLASTALVLTTI